MMNEVVRTVNHNAPTIEGVAVGALTAIAANPPAILKRFYYYCQHNRTTLTNPDAKKAFELFYQCLLSIINITGVTYPEGLENCLEKFKNTLPGESDIYKFQPLEVFDVRQVKEALRTFTLTVNGKKIKQESLPSAVIDMVLQAPCMRSGRSLSVPKIIFSFLVSMSLEFAATDNPVEKRDLVSLMSEVAQSAHSKSIIREQFITATFESGRSLEELIGLVALFQVYLKNEYHLADSEKILIGAREFKCSQVERTKKRFDLLLTLTEGGILPYISSTFARIARNDLSIGRADPLGFSDNNPFKELLMQTAGIFTNVDESYNLIAPDGLVKVPTKERIKFFIQSNLEANGVTTRSSILYPLLWTNTQRGNTYSSQRMPSNSRNVDTVTDYLFDLATGLAKDAQVSIIAAHFYIATNNNGQEWLEGYSEFIEEFIKEYSTTVNTDDEFLSKLLEYISQFVGRVASPDHDVIDLIKALLSCNDELRQKGINPLKDFSSYKLITTPVIKRVQENLKSFFLKTPIRLKTSAININESTLRALGEGSNTTLEAIKKILTEYAAHRDHQYKFRCSDLQSSITILETETLSGDFCFKTSLIPGENKKHKARAKLFLTLFRIIVRSNTTETETDKLADINSEINKSLSSDIDLFTSSDATGINATLFKILNLIVFQINTRLITTRIAAEASVTKVIPTETTENRVLPEPAGSPLAPEIQVDQIPAVGNNIPCSQSDDQPKCSLSPQILTNFLRELANWIKDKPSEFETFELFWRKLFYLNNNRAWNISSQSDFSRIRGFQEKARFHKEKRAQSQHYNQLLLALRSGNQSKESWANAEFSELTKLINTSEIIKCSNSALKQRYLNAQITIIQKEIKTLAVELDHYHDQVLARIKDKKQPSIAMGVPLWPNIVKEELVKSLTQYSKATSIQIEPDLILQAIASRLLQTEIYQNETEETGAQANFDKLFGEAIYEFINATDLRKQGFRKTILEGILMLGANPITWIDQVVTGNVALHNLSQGEAGNPVVATGRNHLDVALVFGKLSDVIINNLLIRSRFLGDSSIYLQNEITKISSSINVFIRALQHSVNSKYWLLTLFDYIKHTSGQAATFRWNAVNSEHRDKRVSLYLSVIKLVYIILNDSIADITPTSNICSPKFRNASALFFSARNTCEQNITQPTWKKWFASFGFASFVVNTGRPGYKELTDLLHSVDELLHAINRVAMNRATLIRIQQQDSQTAVVDQRRQMAEENSRRHEAEAEKNKAEREKAEMTIKRRGEALLNKVKTKIIKSLDSQGIERTSEGIINRKSELFNEVYDLYSGLVEDEQLVACVDECVGMYLTQQTPSSTPRSHVSFFAETAPSGNIATTQPTAALAGSLGRSN